MNASVNESNEFWVEKEERGIKEDRKGQTGKRMKKKRMKTQKRGIQDKKVQTI